MGISVPLSIWLSHESGLFLSIPIKFDYEQAEKARGIALQSKLMGIINTHDFQDQAKGIGLKSNPNLLKELGRVSKVLRQEVKH